MSFAMDSRGRGFACAPGCRACAATREVRSRRRIAAWYAQASEQKAETPGFTYTQPAPDATNQPTATTRDTNGLRQNDRGRDGGNLALAVNPLRSDLPLREPPIPESTP